MYDYAYEDDVLSVLRVLKLLKERQPQRFAYLQKAYKELTAETMEELVWEAVWELFDESWNDFDEDFETEVWTIRDASIDAFWGNLRKRALASGSSKACEGLLKDTLAYFLDCSGNSVVRIECHTHSTAAQIRLWMSPDVYEPSTLGCDVVAFLQYVEAENKRYENQTIKEAA